MIVIDSTQRGEERFEELVTAISAAGAPSTALHLRVSAYHDDLKQSGGKVPLQVADIKSVLMPTTSFLRKLDPTGKLPIARLRALMAPHAAAFRRLVVNNIDNGEDIKQALKIYDNFYLIQYKPEWGDYPASCTCPGNYAHGCCWHSLLYASLFNPEVCVPDAYIAATVDLRKKCKSLKGVAGRKRFSIMKAMACDEKEVASKVRYMRPTAAAAAGIVLPPVVFPSDDDDDDFEVNAHLCSRIPAD
jgi:hypothetical protein